jgi:hypothetical protein
MDKTIYISGPMEGYENDNFDCFNDMERILESIGYGVVNPVKVYVDKDYQITTTPTRQDYYRKDIRALTYCDEIVMLKGWNLSHGAQFERYVALEMGLRIRYEEELLVSYGGNWEFAER